MNFILTLQIGSITIRAATAAVVVASDAGDLVFDSGLVEDGGYSAAWSLGGTPIVRVPVELAPGVLDVPALIRAGHTVTAAVGELAAIAPGETYEQRRVLVAGRVSEPEYDDAAHPVSFSLRMLPSRTHKLVPPASAVVQSGGAWDDLHDGTEQLPTAAAGLVVPIVFGEPASSVPAPATAGAGAGSTAVCVEAKSVSDKPFVGARIYIASEPVGASTVQVAYAAPEVADRYWVSHNVESDERGAYCDLLTGLFNHDTAYQTRCRMLVRWLDGRGIMRATSSEPIKTAGDLLEYLLYKLPECDRERTSAAVPYLPQLVDGYIDTRVDVLDWIRDNVQSVFPVQIANGPDGIYPVVGRPYLTPELPARELSTERGEIYPAAPVVWDGSDKVYNSIEVRYGLDAGSRQYLRTALHTGDPNLDAWDDVARSTAARASFLDYGERSKVVTSTIVHRETTAHQIAAWQIRRYALPSRVTSYTMPELPAWVEPGAGVEIVDPVREIRGLCLVEEVRHVGGTEYAIRVRTVEA